MIQRLNGKLASLSGKTQAFETSFGVAGSNPEKLLRALRIYIDGGQRDLSESSLGAANVLYLALRTLELEELAKEAERLHTFFAIEEPEAHLHPHLQRTVYREYLAEKNEVREAPESISYFLTTHSPHIASVTPLNSLVVLRKMSDGSSTGVSTAGLKMDPADKSDIERYLDVSRAEVLFGRGVILVEGDAEKFLIPLLAKRAGYDLDAMGITLCSVSGTNFLPYVKFFGSSGLNMPLAVLTDFDPYNDDKSRGRIRVKKIVTSEFDEDFRSTDVEALKHEEHGLFLNMHTFEIDFYYSGYIHMMAATMNELCPVNSAIDRFAKIAKQCEEEKINVPLEDEARFLKDIEYVGKGRFAQRVAWHISQLSPDYVECPEYIIKGISYVKAQLL